MELSADGFDINQPSSYLKAIPSDVIPLSLYNHYIRLHNYMINMNQHYYSERTLSLSMLNDYQFLSESLLERVKEESSSSVVLNRKLQQINVGFQFYSLKQNWSMYFKHDENELKATSELDNIIIQDVWTFQTRGFMIGTSVPLWVEPFVANISIMLSSGIMQNTVTGSLGAFRTSYYDLSYLTIPLHAGLTAEYSLFDVLSVNSWFQVKYPLYQHSKNQIDEWMFAGQPSLLSYGIDLQAHLMVAGAGVYTTLGSSIQSALERTHIVSSSQNLQTEWEPKWSFNLSLFIPIEAKERK